MEKIIQENLRLIEDSTKVTSTRCVLNFQTEVLNKDVFRGHLEQVFQKTKFPGKIQCYTGRLLKHKLTDEYRYYYAQKNTNVFETALKFTQPEDINNVLEELLATDLNEELTKDREDSTGKESKLLTFPTWSQLNPVTSKAASNYQATSVTRNH